MKAVVLKEKGGNLEVEEIRKPVPKNREVLVKVTACGVCHTDLHVMKGEVNFPMPCVLGHEISGIIESVGPDVVGIRTGESVVSPFIMPCGTCRFCAVGRDDLCENFFRLNRLRGTLYDGETRLFRDDGTPLWMYSMGGLAEYAVIPATSVFRLPASLDSEAACTLGCAVFTAYGAVKNQAGLEKGESVAVVAVGGVGMNMIQLSKAFGAKTIIAVDVADGKLEAAKAAGATHVVNSSNADPVKEVMRLTDNQGVDVSFEALGRPATVTQAFNLVADGGRVVVVGIAPQNQAAQVEITRLVRRGIRLIGSYGARTRRDMPEIISLAEQGRLDVRRTVTRRYRLEEAGEAYSALNRGEIIGRAIITMMG
jgi:S-(hydroxymethyl)glutathione dehydrogenase/alcohol dehydrogenase